MIARYFSPAANRTGPRGADGLCRWLSGHAIADSFRKQHPRRKIVPSHTSPTSVRHRGAPTAGVGF